MPKYRRGDGRIYRRAKTWWLSYYTNGQHVCGAAKSKECERVRRRADAREILRTKIGERAERRLVVGDGKVTFEDLMAFVEADYTINGRKSLDKAQCRRKHLAKSFAERRATAIGLTEIDAFIARRHEEKAGNAEINRELSVLRRALNLALQSEKMTRMPKVKRLPESNPRAGFFEPAEFATVVKHLPEYLKAPLTFAYLTGWRCRSEALPLVWRNVDFQAGTVRLGVGSTKSKGGRAIYMAAALRQLLEAVRETTLPLQRDQERLIPLIFHKRGNPIANYYKARHRACGAAGMSGKIPHDFRRTAVRNMVRAGIPESVAMQMAGHKTRSVFDRYHIVAESDLQEAARKLEAAFALQTATHLATVEPLHPPDSIVSARNS